MVKRNPPANRDKIKIASFRITEGEWFDFSEEAERQNVTATDVIKGSIRQFMTGEFVLPEPMEKTPDTFISQIGSIDDVEKLVSTAVGIAISNLSILSTDQVIEIASSEAHKATQPIFDDVLEVRKELAEVKSAFSKESASLGLPELTTTDKDPLVKTWGAFFQMVGIEALSAKEAQKKEKEDIRTRQIEQGIKAARAQGLGEWVVKRVGRDFIRC